MKPDHSVERRGASRTDRGDGGSGGGVGVKRGSNEHTGVGRELRLSVCRPSRAIEVIGRSCGAVLLLGSVVVAFAARMPADRDELRKLSSLPMMHFQCSVSPVRGQLRWAHDLAKPEEIGRLQKELRDDATDAVRWLDLARLCEDAGRTNQEQVAYSNAIAAFRRQAEIRPKDGPLLAHLGEALAGSRQRLEAEAVLRRAVRLGLREPECWTQLGLFLCHSSYLALQPEKMPPDLEASPALLVTKYKPSGEQFERAQKLAQESMECFDRAISLAPKDEAGFERRACGRSVVAFVRTVKGQVTTPGPERFIPMPIVFIPECLPDLRQAAELSPENASLLAAEAFVEAMCAMMPQLTKKGGGADNRPQDKLWDILTADQAKSFRDRLNRLTELMGCPSTQKAARAAEFLGLLQVSLMRDEPGAEATFRRAVALNPGNQQAWQGLIATLASDGRYERMVEVGEAMVKATGASWSHLALAKAHEKLNHLDKVVEETRAAMRLAPNDTRARLAVACALLRANDQKLLQESASLLKLRAADFKDADNDVRIHAMFICGLQLALENKADQARSLFQEVLRLEPDHEGAKQALTIIDSWK